mgnify:CR=1 FL=1
MLHAAVAARSFRRYSTYRGATLAGIFTNSVFGVIISYVYLALWDVRPHVGGYDATDAVTYAWIGQGLIMVVAMWSGGPTDDLAERVRSGDIAVDLYRPVNLVGWYLAQDFGRTGFHLVTRGTVPMLLGAVLFDLRGPASPLAAAAFALSIALGVVVSFGIRFLVACTAFWLLDASGVRTLSMVAATFFSGLMLPLVVFPEPLRSIALALPWASMLQTPADLWLGRHSGAAMLGALGLQALWAGVLLVASQLTLRAATARVVVQGG